MYGAMIVGSTMGESAQNVGSGSTTYGATRKSYPQMKVESN